MGRVSSYKQEVWFPKPKETIPFSEVPLIKPLPIVDMSKANCDIMRN